MVTGAAVDKTRRQFYSEPLSEKTESYFGGDDAISQYEGACGQV